MAIRACGPSTCDEKVVPRVHAIDLCSMGLPRLDDVKSEWVKEVYGARTCRCADISTVFHYRVMRARTDFLVYQTLLHIDFVHELLASCNQYLRLVFAQECHAGQLGHVFFSVMESAELGTLRIA